MSAWRPLEIPLVNAVEVRLATFPSGFGRWFRDWLLGGRFPWCSPMERKHLDPYGWDASSRTYVGLLVIRLRCAVRLVRVVLSKYLQFVPLGWLIFWVAISIPSTWSPPTHGVYILNFGGERIC